MQIRSAFHGQVLALADLAEISACAVDQAKHDGDKFTPIRHVRRMAHVQTPAPVLQVYHRYYREWMTVTDDVRAMLRAEYDL